MKYEYDVFISYKNQPGLVGWVQQHFQPLLQTWLDHELPYPPTLFRDKVSIAAGDDWNQAIRDALCNSRILIAILTPQYFTSPWCVAEWLSMEQREDADPGTRNQLLIPLKYSNGPHFPEFATRRQFVDCTDYLDVNSTVKPNIEILEGKVKQLARIIASRMQLVPVHQPFPIIDPATVTLPDLPGTPRRPTP
ncbi:MAG: toll/interleukin-1 receptor domain-containing protein [Xanthomonadales bacterium]|jgi:hypothetical protein|nr:toll/interleukin-1 receptor domain-containing protein [Xanthomonadales bacterium]